jgi:hypothetical protein
MFKNIIQKFLTIDKKETEELSEEIQTKFSIQFSIDKNENIDIIFDIGYPATINIADIASISEKYAQLLLTINHGGFKSQIIDTLKRESKESEDDKKILIIDNILSFYDLLKREMLKSSSLYNQPIVSPSMAFKLNRIDD